MAGSRTTGVSDRFYMQQRLPKFSSVDEARRGVVALVSSAFAYNPDQWRNPRNGQWIDMPWSTLRKLFKLLNFDPENSKLDPVQSELMRELHRTNFEWLTNTELRTGDVGEQALEVASLLEKALENIGDRSTSRNVGEAVRRLQEASSELLFTDEPLELADMRDHAPRYDMIFDYVQGWREDLVEAGLSALPRAAYDRISAVLDEAWGVLTDTSQWRPQRFDYAIEDISYAMAQLTEMYGVGGGAYDDLYYALATVREFFAQNHLEENWNRAISDEPEAQYRHAFAGYVPSPAKGTRKARDAGMGNWDKADPASIDDAAKLANVGQYAWNCQKAVMAYEAQRRGYSHVFAGGGEGSATVQTITGAFGTDQSFDMAFPQSVTAFGIEGMRRHYNSQNTLFPEGLSDPNASLTLDEMLAQWPEGARGQLAVRWAEGSAHVVMVEKTERGVVVVDPQVNQLTPWELYTMNPQISAFLSFFRTDDLEIVSDRFTTDVSDEVMPVDVVYGFSVDLSISIDNSEGAGKPVVGSGDRYRNTFTSDGDQRAIKVRLRSGNKLKGRADGAGVQRSDAGSGELPRDERSGNAASLGNEHDTSIDPIAAQTFKYNPAQLRVPKGNGKFSGRWMDSPFALISSLVATFADRAGIDTGSTRTEWSKEVLRPLQEGDRESILERYGKPIPNNWIEGSIQVDPEANSGVIARGKYLNKAGKEVPQALYTTEREDYAAAIKFNRVKWLSENVDKLNSGLEGIGTDPTKAATRLMYLTGIRVGSTDEQRGAVKAYGATTLRMDHLSKNPDGTMQLSFTAKEGIAVSYVVDDPELVGFFENRLNSGASGDDRIFDTNASRTQALLKSITGLEDIKNHDLRTLLANLHAVQLALAAKAPSSKREWLSIRKEISTAVAEILRNKPDQARKSYIAPAVFELLEWA